MDLNTVPASMKSLAIATGALAMMAGGLWAPPAHASAPQPRSERVSYADLDLRSEAGRTTFHGRLRRAVIRVCREPNYLSIEAFQRERACRQQTTRVAQQQMQRVILLAQAGTPG